jgi:hypothetical protein
MDFEAAQWPHNTSPDLQLYQKGTPPEYKKVKGKLFLAIAPSSSQA